MNVEIELERSRVFVTLYLMNYSISSRVLILSREGNLYITDQNCIFYHEYGLHKGRDSCPCCILSAQNGSWHSGHSKIFTELMNKSHFKIIQRSTQDEMIYLVVQEHIDWLIILDNPKISSSSLVNISWSDLVLDIIGVRSVLCVVSGRRSRCTTCPSSFNISSVFLRAL